jgi:hypothetical protein
MVEPEIANPHFRMICAFIANRIDDKEINEDAVEDFAGLEEIGVLERYFYARKFYAQEMF